jgi:hypothetical protein
MIEAASTSETPANFYQTTRRNNPGYSHLHTRRLENLKSHSGNILHQEVGFRRSLDLGSGFRFIVEMLPK